MAKMADEIAQVLRAHGVSRIFGIPGGGSSLDLIDAADKAGIPFDANEAHSALYDAERTADLFCKIVNTFSASFSG